MKIRIRLAFLLAATELALCAKPTIAQQTNLTEAFNKASATGSWIALGGACLTAGTYSTSPPGGIPGCVGNPYYKGLPQVGNVGKVPDPANSGALRFTDGYPNGFGQSGAILSTNTVPSSAGIHVTFKTVTYAGYTVPYFVGGVQYGTGADGADGLSFMLLDGAAPATDVGAVGGALSYSCENSVDNTTQSHPDGTRRGFDGVPGGYLGLGIDEFGNFLNQADTTATGYGYMPNRIGLRGAGSVSWASLHANFPRYYPSALYTTLLNGSYLADQAVQATCAAGVLFDYSPTLASPPGPPVMTSQPIADYVALPNAFSVLSGVQIANEAATTRAQATPITYNLDITQDGYLSVEYSVNGGAYQSVLPKTNITLANGVPPSTFRFGFGASTGGSTNVHEVLCFEATPTQQSSSSGSVNEVQTGNLNVGTQVYFAYYNPLNWTGSLTASTVSFDKTTVTLASTPTWDANCALTGGPSASLCPSTGAAMQAPRTPASRTILTATTSGTKAQGSPFEWSSLSSSQRTALDQGDTTQTAARLQYLRGDRSNEFTGLGSGLFRTRSGLLGDIIDSGPTWVGPPTLPYNVSFDDLRNPGTASPEALSSNTYSKFVSTYAARQNVVYVGANDGMVHGFRAGAYDAGGAFVSNSSTPNDGVEVLAYMPPSIVSAIHNASVPALDFSGPQYGHSFYVDGTTGTGDLYYGGSWHTWLVGGLAAGGREIFALDVTDPSTFTEANAATLVVGDWTPTTLSCANVSNCGANLGKTYGTPQIRRFHNGQWGLIFGNGFGSDSGNAGIYIVLISPSGGAPTIYYLQAPAAASNNGIAFTSPVDLDGDHITDYIYAGDLAGNVWRFDVTSSAPANWSSSATALFTTPSGQPITTKLLIASVPSTTTPPRVIVAFGTGNQTPITLTAPVSYASGTQALYGIWDWNMTAWDAKSTVQYAALAGPITITPARLQPQNVTGTFAAPASAGAALAYRTVSEFAICWYGRAGCAGTAGQFGWTLPLPGVDEQIVFSPNLIEGRFVVNTIIPAVYSPLDCTVPLSTGWTMAVGIADGGLSKTAAFTDSKQIGLFEGATAVAGVQANGVGSLVFLNNVALVTQTVSNTPTSLGYNPGTTLQGSRLNWIERR